MNQLSPRYGPECASSQFLETVTDYLYYSPVHDLPLTYIHLMKLSRKEARTEFNRVNKMKSDRLEWIKTILRRNSIEPVLTKKTKEDLEILIQRNVFSIEHQSDAPNAKYVLDPLWFSLAFDLGLLLEEYILNKYPYLYVDLNTYVSKRTVGRHERMVTGFKNEPYKYYGVDFPSIMVMSVTDVMNGSRIKIDFDEVLNEAEKYA